MTEEIKEIFYKLRSDDYYEEHYQQSVYYEKDLKKLENYITNLQKENKEFYQLMEMQNKREYRSKFLKDFQKEHGKNVFPDYDEIYKRYDDYKSRNEKAIESIKDCKKVNGDEHTCIIDHNYLLNILQGGDE